MAKKTNHKGLYKKYIAHRLDGLDLLPDNKHSGGCEYFVLDLSHDPAARKAAIKYAGFVIAEKPDLAHDLITLCTQLHVAAAKAKNDT